MRYREGNAVERWFEAVFDFIDRRYITRRVMALGTFVVVVHVIIWSMWFAQNSPRSGTDIAAILAAIMVPLNALMGYMFGQYAQAGAASKTAPPAATPPGSANVTVNN